MCVLTEAIVGLPAAAICTVASGGEKELPCVCCGKRGPP